MPSLNAWERVQLIMRYLHHTPDNKPQSVESIALATKVPVSSVRKTIASDYPECFSRHFVHKGIILSGKYPGDVQFDLEAEWKPADSTKRQAERPMPVEYFNKGMNGVPKPILELLVRRSRKEELRPEEINTLQSYSNVCRVGWILTRVSMSDDPASKLEELVQGRTDLVDIIKG